MCRELQRHLRRLRSENRRLLRALFELCRLDSPGATRITVGDGDLTSSKSPTKGATVERSPSRRSLLS